MIGIQREVREYGVENGVIQEPRVFMREYVKEWEVGFKSSSHGLRLTDFSLFSKYVWKWEIATIFFGCLMACLDGGGKEGEWRGVEGSRVELAKNKLILC